MSADEPGRVSAAAGLVLASVLVAIILTLSVGVLVRAVGWAW